MCGRTFQKTPLGDIQNLFGTVNPVPNAAPNYNAAPTDKLPVVRRDRDGRRSLDLLRWGLIPYWSKDVSMGARCINAMAETVATKPAFRDAFAQGQRCIVPVDGFYEWKKAGTSKQPHAFVGADGLPLALAGLWDRWTDRTTGETVQTFTILTTVPNELCAPIHDRMPVILPREKWAAWLGEHSAGPDELRWMILLPYPAERMRVYAVDGRVGNVRNNDAALLSAGHSAPQPALSAAPPAC